MTISSTYAPVQYNGNGVTTAFSFPYTFYDESNLTVTLTLISDGTDTVQTNPTNYTVTGGDGDVGTINMVVAPSALYRLTITRELPYIQSSNYVENQAFPAETLESDFDKSVILSQQLNSNLSKTLRFPDTDTSGLSSEIPSAVLRASKYLGFDASGNVVVLDNTEAVDAAADASASAAAAAVSAADANNSAVIAANLASALTGTSTTSNLIATGSKVFTTQTNKTFLGQMVVIANTANTSNFMFGNVTAYSGTTLTVNVTVIGGSGTFSDWIISVSGVRGATGATGPTGPGGAGSGDVTGPASAVSGNVAIYNGTSGKIISDGGFAIGSIAAQNSSGVTITGGTITGITDLAVADGGTGASTAANARTNLGLGNVTNFDQTNASNLSSGTVATARLGTGTANSTTFLRGDGTWNAPVGPTTLAAIGTYAFLKSSTLVTAGSTYTSGSGGVTLTYSDTSNFGGSTPAGTWRAMGSSNTGNIATLFLRIS